MSLCAANRFHSIEKLTLDLKKCSQPCAQSFVSLLYCMHHPLLLLCIAVFFNGQNIWSSHSAFCWTIFSIVEVHFYMLCSMGGTRRPGTTQSLYSFIFYFCYSLARNKSQLYWNLTKRSMRHTQLRATNIIKWCSWGKYINKQLSLSLGLEKTLYFTIKSQKRSTRPGHQAGALSLPCMLFLLMRIESNFHYVWVGFSTICIYGYRLAPYVQL